MSILKLPAITFSISKIGSPEESCYGPLLASTALWRMVVTSDGVVVGVIIRSVEWYDPVKIKQTEKAASAYDSVAYDLVETRLSASEAQVKE